MEIFLEKLGRYGTRIRHSIPDDLVEQSVYVGGGRRIPQRFSMSVVCVTSRIMKEQDCSFIDTIAD